MRSVAINGSDCPLATTAREVNDVLTELKAALDTSLSPHRAALRQLGVDGMGWTSTAYSDEAFKLWSDMLRRSPGDLETLHHLAIMHHARAIDREAGKRPSESDADWTTALMYWARLWQSDAFWDGISAAACKGANRDAVDVLRQRLPELLLKIHFDIAFDSRTQPHRSAYHLRLVDASQLPAQCKDRVRKETYDAMLKGVPNAVWQPDMLDPVVLKQGTDVIEHYLNLDPGCLPALEDALRLQVRLLRAHYTDLQAAGEDSAERRSLLQTFLADAVKWRPYFDQLVPVGEQAAEDVRRKLCLWYRVMGDVHRALDKDAEAIAHYEAGAAAESDDDEQRRCRRKAGETKAYLAREKAVAGAVEAKALCDEVRGIPDLSPKALRFLANAYTLLDGFDTAETLCRQGLECEFDTADLADFDEFQKEQTLLREMLEMVGKARRRHAAEKYIDKARPHIEAGRYQPPLLLLDKAIEVAPDAAQAWFLRCQCHLNLDHSQEARRDLDKFRSLVTAEESSDGIAAADQLEEEVRVKERLVADFGVEGLRRRREAAECLRREDFEQSAQLLRQAAQWATAAGRRGLHEQLSVVLTRWATTEVNAIMKDKSSALDSDAAVCRRATERLEEAVRLDPANDQAQSNLETTRMIANKITSAMLTSRAVDMVNSAQAGGGGAMGFVRLLPVLTEARKLLTEAIELDPDNSRARDSLRTVERMLQQYGQH
jgi:tetratricopeptide (TPR) repeat protein